MSRHAKEMHRVAVIGPGTCSEERRVQAHTVGSLLAQAGVVVVCGGLGGVMDAAARGCRQAGGTCVGFLPGTDLSDASDALSLPVPTGLGEARNVLVVQTSHAVIAIGGGAGTLSEMALAGKLGRPVVALDSWSVDAPYDAAPLPLIRVRTAEEAVDTTLRLLGAAPTAGDTGV